MCMLCCNYRPPEDCLYGGIGVEQGGAGAAAGIGMPPGAGVAALPPGNLPPPRVHAQVNDPTVNAVREGQDAPATTATPYTLTVGQSFIGTIEPPDNLVSENQDAPDAAATPYRVEVGGSFVGTIDRVGTHDNDGVVLTNGDHDWVEVQLVAGTTYRMSLVHTDRSNLDPYLYLRDTSGMEVMRNDDGGSGRNSLITYTATTTGTYYLDAGSWNERSMGTYELSVVAGDAQLQLIEDHDWVAVQLVAGTAYRMDLVSTGVNGGLSDPYLSLRDANGNQVQDTPVGGTSAVYVVDNDSGPGLNSRITFTATTTGTYYLDVGGADEANTGTYRLSVVAGTTDPVEVQDAPTTTATPYGVEVGRSFLGTVGQNGDRDWVEVQLVAGTVYRMAMVSTGGDGLNPYLSLRDARVMAVAADDDGGPGLNSLITYTPTTTGTYYLDAGSFGGGSMESMGPYQLSVVVGGTDLENQQDAPATTATPYRVEVGGSFVGTIDRVGTHDSEGMVLTAGDRDWVAVQLVAGTAYRMSLVHTSGGLNPQLSLRDASGNQVRVDGQPVADTSSGPGQNSLITYTPATTGTYYLDAGSSNARSTGAYRLSVVTADPAENQDAPATTATPYRIEVGGGLVRFAGTIDRVGTHGNNGVVLTNGDHDWVEVRLVAGTTYQMFVSGGDGLIPILTLRDDSGNRVQHDSTTRYYTPATTGTYYLDVGSWNEASMGTYRLSVGAVDEFAPQAGTFDEMAHYLLEGYWVEWSGRSGTPRLQPSGNVVNVHIADLDPTGQRLAMWALQAFEQVIGVRFQVVSDADDAPHPFRRRPTGRVWRFRRSQRQRFLASRCCHPDHRFCVSYLHPRNRPCHGAGPSGALSARDR